MGVALELDGTGVHLNRYGDLASMADDAVNIIDETAVVRGQTERRIALTRNHANAVILSEEPGRMRIVRWARLGSADEAVMFFNLLLNACLDPQVFIVDSSSERILTNPAHAIGHRSFIVKNAEHVRHNLYMMSKSSWGTFSAWERYGETRYFMGNDIPVPLSIN